MFCEFVPDHVLKKLGDHKSIIASKKIKFKRFKSFFKRNPSLVAGNSEHRLTYDCQNKTDLPGVLVLEDDGRAIQDRIAQKAHDGAHLVYDFYMQFFGRDSLDNKGLTLVSSVHYDKNYNNAYFDGSQIIFGDGDNKFFISLVNGIDVTAHEWQHCVTQYTANLVYYHQPGALNESISDCFGIGLKQWVNRENDPATANWLIGDSIVAKSFPGKALRSFKNEKAYSSDTQPKHMRGYVWTFDDNGGVHTNSGIVNYSYYNLCLLMNEPAFGKPLQILYNTLLNIGKFTGFKGFAKEMAKQAEKLYGKTAAEQVKKAYAIAGIK